MNSCAWDPLKLLGVGRGVWRYQDLSTAHCESWRSIVLIWGLHPTLLTSAVIYHLVSFVRMYKSNTSPVRLPQRRDNSCGPVAYSCHVSHSKYQPVPAAVSSTTAVTTRRQGWQVVTEGKGTFECLTKMNSLNSPSSTVSCMCDLIGCMFSLATLSSEN